MNKYAIIGFGGAGYQAAKEIRRLDPEAVIDVYSDTDTGPCNPMLTTYYVKNAIPYEALFPFGSLEDIRRDLRLQVHANRPVTGLVPGFSSAPAPPPSCRRFRGWTCRASSRCARPGTPSS